MYGFTSSTHGCTNVDFWQKIEPAQYFPDKTCVHSCIKKKYGPIFEEKNYFKELGYHKMHGHLVKLWQSRPTLFNW